MSVRDSTSLSGDVAQWAQHALGIDAAPGTDKWQSQVLQQLTASDFMPPDDWYDAIDVYQGAASVEPELVPLGYFRDREDEAQEQVGQFASQYFDLVPQDRRDKWEELTERCAPWPVLKARLEWLGRGLKVVPTMSATVAPSIIELGNLVCRKYLRISENDERKSWLQVRLMRQKINQWEKVAQRFRIEYPELYALLPEFVDSLANFSRIRNHQRWQELIPEGLKVSVETLLLIKRGVIIAFIVFGLISLAVFARSNTGWRRPPREQPIQSQPSPRKSFEKFMNELQDKLQQQERDKGAAQPAPGL